MSSIYDLELDPDVLHENGSTYESLLDQNQIDLFSDQRFEQQEKDKVLLKEKENDIVQGLFLGNRETDQDDFTYSELLFLQPMVIEKKQSYQTEDKESGRIVWIGSAVLLILFILVMAGYFRQRRKREEQDEW